MNVERKLLMLEIMVDIIAMSSEKNLLTLLLYELNMCVQCSVSRHFSGAKLLFKRQEKELSQKKFLS